MKKIIKSIIYKFYTTDYKKVKNIIMDYNYISFDIFDTLIKRNVKNPIDIFDVVEKRYNNPHINFKENRINAEKKARNKSKNEEITLKEIYKELNYPKNMKEDLYHLEIKTEKEFCTANKEFLKLYNYCVEKKKKIIFTSDMYLPKKIIEEILKENGYKYYKKLYLSNEENATKHSGSIFKKIIEDLHIEKKDIIHIGDSIKGDFLIPKKLGIKSILIKRNINNSMFLSKKNKTLEYNILSSFINNNIDQSFDYYTKFGYEIFGPILYSFVSFIHERVKKDKIDKIYFLARDAKMIMDVYKQMFKDEIPTYYINVSRKAMIMSSVDKLNDFDDIYNKAKSLFRSKSTTVKDMFDIFRLDYLEYPFGNKFLYELDNKQKSKLFYILKDPLEMKCKKQNEYLKRYLKQNDFFGRIALVDIGWNGTTQYHFEKYTNTKIELFGYYYGVYKTKVFPEYEQLNKTGYLFDNKQGFDYQSIIHITIAIFETMFLSTGCSTIGYQEKGNLIVPIYAEKDNDESDIIKIINIQKGAKEMIKKIKQSKILELTKMSKDVYLENYKNFATNPTLNDIKMFKNIKFTNINNGNLIENKSIFYYLFHLKKLYLDFRTSSCKLMFMKSVLKVKLPYYKILTKLYKIYMKE